MPILLEDDRAAYVPIEKVACSSIKAALGAHLGIANPKQMPHNWAFAKISRAELLEHGEIFRFAFVRNPFDRLLSCWAHKVVRYAGERMTCPLWPSLLTSTSLVEFAAWVSQRPPKRCNWHIRPQWCFLEHAGQSVVDHVFRFERLAEDWARLQVRYGWPDLPHRNATEHPDYREVFTPGARWATERFYRQDLDLFGYEF